jgi:hypothetical protein
LIDAVSAGELRASDAGGLAGPSCRPSTAGNLESSAGRGRQAASERTGVAWLGLVWFCYSRLMITGVSSLLHYREYELVLILLVTVFSLPHPLSFQRALLLPAENKKSPSSYLVFLSLSNPRQTRNSSFVARCRSPSCDSARTELWASRCLRNRCSPENPARGVRAIRFLGEQLCDCSHVFFVFFLVTSRSRESALRTSSCIACDPLLRATH